ncbi:hypothetical protein D3C86_2030820 [compost metagenome]
MIETPLNPREPDFDSNSRPRRVAIPWPCAEGCTTLRANSVVSAGVSWHNAACPRTRMPSTATIDFQRPSALC